MTDIAAVLGSMASLVIVTLLGYVAARAGYLTAEVCPRLSALIFNVTLPCTILASVGEVDSSAGAEQITWSFVLGFAFFFVMLAAASLASLVLRVPRDELTPDGRVHDPYRIDYLRRHFEQVRLAITDGVDLIGYCLWSFMDLVSTHQGYGKRYGFVYVDRGETDLRSMARVKKDSFAWYRHVIETNGAEL